MSEVISLLAAVFSAIATGFAAFGSINAPKVAAKLAESLRRESEIHNERQKHKMNVLSMLMQERAQIYSENAVQALNLIDIVFNDSPEVREAWSELFLSFQIVPIVPHVTDERLRKLLGAMAKDIGLSDKLRNDDLGRVYHPEIRAQEQFIKDTQRKLTLTSLLGQNSTIANNSSQTPWPPKP